MIDRYLCTSSASCAKKKPLVPDCIFSFLSAGFMTKLRIEHEFFVKEGNVNMLGKKDIASKLLKDAEKKNVEFYCLWNWLPFKNQIISLKG